MKRRRLFWHGIFLFFLGLLSGVFVQTTVNPRMGLAAHTSGVASGTFLAVLGAVWSELRLGTRADGAAYWLAATAPARAGRPFSSRPFSALPACRLPRRPATPPPA